MLREEKITEKIGKYIPMDCLRFREEEKRQAWRVSKFSAL